VRLPGRSKPNSSTHCFEKKSDSALIAACLTGDQDAWSALIDRYRGLIYKLALSMGLSTTDSADVLQEVSLLMVDHLGDIRDRSRLSQWLIVTTKRVVWKRLRQRAQSIDLETIEYDPSDDSTNHLMASSLQDPEQVALALADQALVRQALSSLPDRCRLLLTLLYCQDPPCSYSEVSSRLDMPVNSVSPSRARCLQHLKKILAGLGF
jgi:RNA polymerase sigma factor (sigma-70 family)